jgi:hypothetical protein
MHSSYLNRLPLRVARPFMRSGRRYLYDLSRKILWPYRSLLKLRNFSTHLRWQPELIAMDE